MERVGRWLDHAGRRGWQLGGVAVGVYVLWALLGQLLLLIVTLFIAAVLAALLLPAARWLERRGVPRTLASVLVVLGGVLAVGGLLTLVGMRIGGQAPELGRQFEDVRRGLAETLRASPLDLPSSVVERPIEQLAELARSHGSAVARRLFGALGALGALVTAVILTYMIVRDGDRMRDWTLERITDDDRRERVDRAAARAGRTLHDYAKAVVVIGGLDAVLIGIALVVLGVPLAVPLAVLTFFGGFFPVIGATLAGGLAALVALASGGVVQGLVVVAVVVVVQQVDGNLLQPVVMGRAVDLHPAVVLVALTAGGLLAGIVGALLAVPLVAVATAAAHELWDPDGEPAPSTGLPSPAAHEHAPHG